MTGGSSGVRLRAVTAADVPNLAGVQLRSALAGFAHIFPESLPKPTQADLEAEWAAVVANPDKTVLAALVDGVAVGVVVFGPDHEPDTAADSMLFKLYVAPTHFGSGIGSLLYDRAIDSLRRQQYSTARLWVLEDNTKARGMYERRGWTRVPGVRSDWPGSGVNEIGYVLNLA